MTKLDYDALKHDFDADGFVVVRGYLSPQEVSEMRRRLACYRANVDGWQGEFRNGGAVKCMDRHDRWFREYLLRGRHIPLMKHLIGDDLAPDNVTWIDKPEGVKRTMPHYDAIGSYLSPPSGISLWIALDRISLGNGCLHYEQGSHKREKSKAYPMPDYDEQNPSAVPVEVDPGDAVMHSALTVHWSGVVEDRRPRNAMVFVYWGASSKERTGFAEKSGSGYAKSRVTV